MPEKAEVRVAAVEYMMGANIGHGRVTRESTTARVITPLGEQWVTLNGYMAERRYYPQLIAAAMDKAWAEFCNVR